MFGLFKKKEVIERNLEEEVLRLNQEFKNYFKSYCFNGKKLVVYERFAVYRNDIHLYFRHSDTPVELIEHQDYFIMCMQYEDDFIRQQRIRFTRLKKDFEDFGIKISK